MKTIRFTDNTGITRDLAVVDESADQVLSDMLASEEIATAAIFTGKEYAVAGVYNLVDIEKAVKEETTRRINAYVSANTRDNAIASLTIALTIDPDLTSAEGKAHRDFVTAAMLWINDMRTVCKTLIINKQEDYAKDSHWPAVPDLVRLNYQRY